MEIYRTPIRAPGQLTPTLSLTGAADLLTALAPQLGELGPLAALFGRELIHIIEASDTEASR